MYFLLVVVTASVTDCVKDSSYISEMTCNVSSDTVLLHVIAANRYDSLRCTLTTQQTVIPHQESLCCAAAGWVSH